MDSVGSYTSGGSEEALLPGGATGGVGVGSTTSPRHAAAAAAKGIVRPLLRTARNYDEMEEVEANHFPGEL